MRNSLPAIAGIAAIALLLAWLMGAFQRRLPPGPPVPRPQASTAGKPWVVATTRRRTSEAAVGTIRAVHETVVASRLLGRLASLAVTRAGQAVEKDEVLAQLEATDLEAVAEQAKATHRAAVARRDKARLDLSRTEQLVQQGAAAVDKLDTDRAALATAEAEAERAQQNIAAAASALGYATIRAPIRGIVVDKLVQVGDVLQPGQAICTLYDPTRLQLVAVVREELAGRLTLGQEVDVGLDALGKQCRGTVAEIVPAAQAQSRSFEVKVTGPCQPGIVTGMFGRLTIPLDEVDELRVPLRAVQAIGQLDFVQVLVGTDSRRRYVRLGDRDGESVHVLAGLVAGETILVPDGN